LGNIRASRCIVLLDDGFEINNVGKKIIAPTYHLYYANDERWLFLFLSLSLSLSLSLCFSLYLSIYLSVLSVPSYHITSL